MRSIQKYFLFLKKGVSTSNKKRLLWLLSCNLFSNILNVLLPIVQRNTYNHLGNEGDIRNWIVTLFIIGLLFAAAKFIETFLRVTTSIQIQKALQLRLITTGVESSNAAIESRGAGAYLSSAYGDCEQIGDIISGIPVWSALLSVIQVVAVFAITLQWTTMLLVVALPAYLIIMIVTIRSANVSNKEFQAFREILMRINPKIMEIIENRTSVLGYMGLGRGIDSIEKMLASRDKHVTKSTVVTELSSVVISLCTLLSQIAFIGMSAYQIAVNKINLGELVALLAYLPLIFSPLSIIKDANQQLDRFSVLADRIGRFMERKIGELPQERGPYSFQECQISFQENGADCAVFQNFNFVVKDTVGIVGLSGSGKTSLIKTMLGKITPNKGCCLIGGKAVAEIVPEFLLTLVRYYPQTPEVFDDDLCYNITFGKERISYELYDQKRKELIRYLLTEGNSQKIRKMLSKRLFIDPTRDEACKLQNTLKEWTASSEKCEALADYFLNGEFYIGEKYDELIEKLDLKKLEARKLGARGNCISGGEKNKIALARFLLPENATFFILDEPFTNIDVISLRVCIETFKKFKPCSKGIIVSHNLQIIHQLCDKVMVMEEGSKPIVGAHNDLLYSNELYKSLWSEYEAFSDKDRNYIE